MIDLILEYVIDPLRTNPVAWLVLTLVQSTIIWKVFSYFNSNSNESIRSQLDLARDQLADYKDKLNGASPDEARHRVKVLEEKIAHLSNRVDLLGPRRLGIQQKETLLSRLSIGRGRTISIAKDGASADASTFGADLSDVFRQAGWNVESPVVLGLGNPPPTGIQLAFNPVEAKEIRAALLQAFDSCGLKYDLGEDLINLRSRDGKLVCEITLTTATRQFS